MTDQLGAMTTIFTEFYFFLTIVLMFFIHVGFCMYEVGVARTKNVQHTLLKNAMAIPVVGLAFFLFGMWLYIAPQGWPVSTSKSASPPVSSPGLKSWLPISPTASPACSGARSRSSA